MKPGVAIPALGPDGWIKEPSKALDRLIAYAFESDKSQTYSYGDNIVSIPWIYADNLSSPEDMASTLSSRLTTLLERHFPVAEVSCTSREVKPGSYELILMVSVTDDKGNKHDLNRLAKGNNTKITEILNYLGS